MHQLSGALADVVASEDALGAKLEKRRSELDRCGLGAGGAAAARLGLPTQPARRQRQHLLSVMQGGEAAGHAGGCAAGLHGRL